MMQHERLLEGGYSGADVVMSPCAYNRRFLKRKICEEIIPGGFRDKVFVLILTTVESWATTLGGLMGELRSTRFTETSTTPATELQKSLVGIPFERTASPFCVKHRIDPATMVPDGAEMNLVIANDQARKWLGIRACRAGGRESFFLIVRTSRLQEALIFLAVS